MKDIERKSEFSFRVSAFFCIEKKKKKIKIQDMNSISIKVNTLKLPF